MNMKTFITFLILILLGSFLAFGQDSLYIGTPQTDTLTAPLIDCYQYQCSPTVSHTYIVASSYNGAIDIAANMPIEILLMTEDYIRFDTCANLTSWAMMFRLEFDFPQGTRIIINSYEGSSVTVYSKTDSAVTRQIPQPIALIDTLCNLPTAITEPIKPRRLWEFDGQTWRQVTETRPNMLYKEVE